jgi:uncharacterized integral membrane protein
MLSMTRKRAGGATPDPTADAIKVPSVDEHLTVGRPLAQHVQSFDRPAQTGETRRGRSRRMARRTRLHGYAVASVALFAFVIAIASANTARVKVSWLFGSSHVSLVWLVLATAILGWLIGLLTNTALSHRTRAPRQAPLL